MSGHRIERGPVREYLLAFADDEHAIGSRHANWIGLGPFLEEDLAFCSIAQDELGHALVLYEYLTEDIDHFALLRNPADYRSCWLAEWPCDTWAEALVRHWLYDRAEEFRWQALRESTVPGLADLAHLADREESFHRDHARLFLDRILRQPGESRALVTQTMEELLPMAMTLWDPPEDEDQALAEGVATTTFEAMAADWTTAVTADMHRWDLDLSWPASPITPPSGRTERSPGFAEFHAALGEVIALDPAATW